MITWRSKSFNENRFDSDYLFTDRPIWVNACGIDYLNIPETDYEINRPNGRKDYQLIYIKSGKVIYRAARQEQVLHSPALVLYRPEEPQYYCYPKDVQTEAYWIHFSGYEIDSLFTRFGYDFKYKTLSGEFYEFENTVNKLLKYIDRPEYCEICPALLKVLIIQLSDRELRQESGNDHRLLLARKKMDRTYHEDHSIAAYAAEAGYNERYFIRSFKDQFGTTPRRYINKLRIDRAIHMLQDTAMSIQAIAKTVGFTDPYYFSRLFKQFTGKTPSEYRKHL